MIQDLTLLPVPRRIKEKEGTFSLQDSDCLWVDRENKNSLYQILVLLQEEFASEIGLDPQIKIFALQKEKDKDRRGILFLENKELSDQEYILEIKKNGIQIQYSRPRGAFYATRTLKQIIKQCGRQLPALEIKDRPDLENRAVMLDISRNKIPTKETIFEIIDHLADMKYNQFQLYIEGFPFAYQSFPQVWQYNTPLTGGDIMEIDQYCQQKYIELVPNQNSFGHMAPWLQRREFKHLAECPGGFEMHGSQMPPTTLDPTNPESLQLVEDIYDDLLPYFSSEMFNVGCDETFELGQGKSKELCEEKGTGRVYFDYLMKIYEMVQDRNKIMMFWGDIINNHQELISELPSDILALEWGYEADHPFAERGARYNHHDIPFYVCGGTSSWNSILGRTDNMLKNLYNAACSGLKHGAEGFMVTDWGDNGHWQYLPVSYPGYAWGAAVSWNVEQKDEIDLSGYLNKFVFADQKQELGQLLLKLGNYYQYQGLKVGNATQIVKILYSSLYDMDSVEEVTADNLQQVKDYLQECCNLFSKVKMDIDQASLILKEIQNAVDLVKHGVELGQFKLELQKEESSEEISEKLKTKAGELKDDLDKIIKRHKQLWLARNRYSELDKSISHWQKLSKQYQDLL